MFAKRFLIFIIIAFLAATLPLAVFAADTPAPSKCRTDTCKLFEGFKNNFLGFLRWLFPVGIATAALLSVIMIIFAGFQWMAGAINPPQIEAAKARIGAALGGLFLALFSWLILYTINPDLVKLRPVSKLKVECPIDKTTGQRKCPELRDILFGEATPPYLSNDQKQIYDVCKNNGGSPEIIQRGAGFQVLCTPSTITRLTTPLSPTAAATAVLPTETINLSSYNFTPQNVDQVLNAIEDKIKKHAKQCSDKNGKPVVVRNATTRIITLHCLTRQ